MYNKKEYLMCPEELPQQWKDSITVPIYKKGYIITNYIQNFIQLSSRSRQNY
jgi:hypothetical protein